MDLSLLLLLYHVVSVSARNIHIPTVDLSEPDEESAKTLYHAATTSGFFYLINHGISETKTNGLFSMMQDFFSLNNETKLSLKHNSTHWGYVPFRDESTDPSKQHKHGQFDTKEGFYLHNNINNTNNHYENDNNNNNNIRSGFELLKKNQWPVSGDDDNTNNYFKETVLDYMGEMYGLSNRLLEIIALSLELPRSYFTHDGAHIHDENSADLLNLIHYPPIESDIKNGVYGTGEHSDYSLFTILLTDDAPGLEVFNQSTQEWMQILDNKINNSLIINIADTLELWTNNLFKSAKHRVILNGKSDRYSIPYFVTANYDCIIDCLPIGNVTGNDDIDTNCNHIPFRSGNYLHYKLKTTHQSYKDSETCTNSRECSQNLVF